jgi:hypothetical protein
MNQNDKVRSPLAPMSRKFVLNLSEHVLTDSEEPVLTKDLNFAIAKPHSNLDMAYSVESVVSKLPQTLGIKFRWKVRSILQKSKSSTSNMSKKEIKAIKSLGLNQDIRILPADKGNCIVVLEESKYND